MGLKLKPCDAHGRPGRLQHRATWGPLAIASHNVGPDGDAALGTWLKTEGYRQPQNEKHISESKPVGDVVLDRLCPPF